VDPYWTRGYKVFGRASLFENYNNLAALCGVIFTFKIKLKFILVASFLNPTIL
jgi:hypothetical protein